MTVGHRIPNQRLGTATLDNVQTECARCNETIRNLLEDPETFDSLKPLLDALSQDELRELNSWISDGKRRLSNLDLAYSKYHALNELGREQANAYIAALVIN